MITTQQSTLDQLVTRHRLRARRSQTQGWGEEHRLASMCALVGCLALQDTGLSRPAYAAQDSQRAAHEACPVVGPQQRPDSFLNRQTPPTPHHHMTTNNSTEHVQAFPTDANVRDKENRAHPPRHKARISPSIIIRCTSRSTTTIAEELLMASACLA